MQWIGQRDVRIMTYLAALTAGIWSARVIDLQIEWWLPAWMLVAAVTMRQRQTARWLIILVLAFSLGLQRGQDRWQELADYQPLLGQKVTIQATIDDDPTRHDSGQRLFYADNAELDGQQLAGRIRISGYGADGLRRGDQIEISGKLRDGFGPYQAAISFAEIEPIGRADKPIEDFRGRFFAAINTLISDPESSLGLGFIVGLRALLPDELLDVLSKTGLTHIVAVSGYNLTVIIRGARRVAAKRSRFLAAASSIFLVLFFLTITGLVPSVFRASIIAGASLGAWYYGLRIRPLTLIFLGSAITAWINPLFIWFDIGWWLSFLAFFGVMVIGPLIINRLYRGDRKPGFIEQVAIETFAAQLMALPLIAYTFGEVSIISLLANVLVNPLIPVAMALVAIAGASYLIWPTLAGWLAWPAQQLLSAMVALIDWLATAPGALAQVDLSRSGMLAVYAAIITITLVWWRKSRLQINGAYLIE